MASAAPLRNPIPKLLAKESEYYTEAQWETLFSLIDVVAPAIVTDEDLTDKKRQLIISTSRFVKARDELHAHINTTPDDEVFRDYLGESAIDNPEFVHNCKRIIQTLSPGSRKEIGVVLRLLNTRFGSWFLTGYCTPTHELPIHIREETLQNWSTGWKAQRVLARAITTIARKAWVHQSPLFRQLVDYAEVPPDYKAGIGYDYNFLQFEAGTDPHTINADVVIVGSGCGGAVCAKTLAEAGYEVVIVDKGYHFPPSHLPMDQDGGSHWLMENQGFSASADSTMAVLAGSCWGGGGTVNWSASLETPDYVRREWVEQNGLPYFGTADYQDALDRVRGVMGVSDAHIRHNHGSAVIKDGCTKLGWDCKDIPQNTGGTEHYCGRCHLGCGSAEKHGTTVTWLPAAGKAGARFIEGFEVGAVTFDDKAGASKRATGVVGTWTSRDKDGGVGGPIEGKTQRKVQINAKKVIVSSGSIWSPVVLLKSGLKNKNIGQNLHLHPCNVVLGIYEEEVRPWEGGIMTALCSTFENLDGKGHGPKLEPVCMLPSLVLPLLPWFSALDFKLLSLKYKHMNGYISLTRDRDAGHISLDPLGGPRINYTPSTFDHGNTLAGCVGLAKILYTTGATEIHACLPGVKAFVRDFAANTNPKDPNDINADPAFSAWIAELERTGNKPPVAGFSSAHQMGSCRMSSDPGSGVTDPRGKVWEVDDLFVADASVFPSASGANPMITTMAISDYIARNVLADLESGGYEKI